ncbi:MAG: cytochrome c family protein [Deltaproteobacteria bacterium]|nr:MAG: cytochrome c family protein [Deltaproteobacteria bacterium]
MTALADQKNEPRKAGKNALLIFWMGLIFVFVAGFLIFFYIPPAADIGAAQPIAFSHRVHAGIKNIQCQFCHSYVGRSSFPGIPPVEKCLYCHKYVIANHPEIQKEHMYFNTKTPTPWKKVFYLPEHVFFNHQRHIKKDIACQECHGPVETMDRLKGKKFKMGFCITCHKARGANLDCWLACHN